MNIHRSFSVCLDFTDDWFDANIDVDLWDNAHDSLMAIPNVTEVCINHAVWVKADLGNWRPEDLTAVTDEIEAAVVKVIEENRQKSRWPG